jgi:uncharacterized membrane protein YidH (DUF202 family)
MKTSHKALIFFAAVFLLGFLDWLTTVVGLLFCGGTELNPILSGLTKSNMIAFSASKLAAVMVAGFAAYTAVKIAKNSKNSWRLTNKLVNGGFALTVLALSVVVANNMMIVFKI